MASTLTAWPRNKILEDTIEHKSLHAALGIDKEFIQNLINEIGDLQFVVRLAVIVEGATAFALQKKVSQPEVADWITENATHSERLGLAEKLKIIDSKSLKVFRKLSEIRNKFAHRPENLNKKLEEFYIELDIDKQKSMIDAFAYFLTETTQTAPYDDTVLRTNFRDALLTVTMVPLFELSSAIANK